MSELKCIAELRNDFERIRRTGFSACDQLAKIHTVDKLKQQIGIGPRFSKVINVNDIVVVQLGQHLSFALKPFVESRSHRQLGRQYFQRHVAR